MSLRHKRNALLASRSVVSAIVRLLIAMVCNATKGVTCLVGDVALWDGAACASESGVAIRKLQKV